MSRRLNLNLALVVLAVLCLWASTCCGQYQCGPQGCQPRPYVPTAPALVPGPLGGLRPRTVVPLATTPPITARCQPATVRVTHTSDDGRGTCGNGTLIAVDDSRGARRGLVITCAHIQRQDWTPAIILAGVRYPAVVLGVNPAYDLMALEAQVPRPTYLMRLATTLAPPGDALFWEGYVSRAAPGQTITGYPPLVYTGPSRGYIKAMLRASGCTREGQSGGPIYNETGLHAVLVAGIPSQRIVEGPCAAYIRQWLRDCCQVVIDEDDHYRIDIGDQPDEPTPPDEPTIDPETPPVDIEIPIPGEDPDPPEEGDDPKDDGELTLMLTEITNNQTNIITNQAGLIENQTALVEKVEDLASRVTALEITVASLDSQPGPAGPQGPKGDKGDPGTSPTAAEVAALVKVEPGPPGNTGPPGEVSVVVVDSKSVEVFRREKVASGSTVKLQLQGSE